MKEINYKFVRNKKTLRLVLFSILVLFIIGILSYAISMIIRNNIISKQASENINLEEKTTTVFCNGKNFTLRDDIFNKIKN